MAATPGSPITDPEHLLPAPDPRASNRLFYGWNIVGVAFVSLFISVGFSFYSYGALFKALADEFGGSRLGVGLGSTLLFTTTGLLAPWLGHQIDRRSIRKMMTLGAVVTAVGFFAVSQIRELWQFYAVFATLVALGLALLGQLPSSALVSNWFVRKRGIALGIATMGVSLSGMVMAPSATLLIEAVGWRGTFQVFSVLTLLVVTPVTWFFIVDRPEDIDLLPDGRRRPPTHEQEEEAEAEELPLSLGEPMLELPAEEDDENPPEERRIHRDRNFWVIAVAIALNFCGNGALLTHLIPHATDLGFTAARSALILSLAAGVGALGKILFGWIADHTDLRVAMWIATALQTIALLRLLTLMSDPSWNAMLGAGAIFGLGMGGIVPLWGSLVGAAFGRRSFGRAMGLMSPVMLPIQLLGVPFTGWIFDHFGTYRPAFMTLVGVYLAAMSTLLLLRLPDRGTTDFD